MRHPHVIVDAMVQWWAKRREHHRYSTDRAGRSSKKFVRERAELLKRVPFWMWTLLVFGIAVGGVIFWFILTPVASVREFAIGAYTAGTIATLYHLLFLEIGAGNISMGRMGEVLTNDELQKLGHEWRVLNSVNIRQGDIDHIAIGPHGIVVIETKWMSNDVTLEATNPWLSQGFHQARTNATDVRKTIGWGARPEKPVLTLLAVWGPLIQKLDDQRPLSDTLQGVRVVTGSQLLEAIHTMGTDEVLDETEQNRIYAIMREFIDKHDARELEANEGKVPFLDAPIQNSLRWIMVLLLGLLAGGMSVLTNVVGFLVSQAVFVGGAFYVSRFTRLRRFVWPWLGGIFVLPAFMAIFLLIAALR